MVHANRKGVEIIAERRMFAKSIIGSARFLRMPPSSRLLYYDLGMYADDDGVVEAFSVMRQTNATEDDLRVLVSKGFVVILNEDLVAVITDWSINNFIRGDRYHPSLYKDLLLQLGDGIPMVDQRYTNGRPRLGKDRLGKDSIEKNAHTDEIKEIISYLNEKTGSKYRPNTDATKKHINARLDEGFTVDDFKTVINIKTDEWLGDKDMQKFLRPQTLFGTKFESYLNQPVPSKKKESKGSDMADEELLRIMSQHEGAEKW